LERPTRFEPQLVAHPGCASPVDLECVRLPTRPVEREHEPAQQTLAKRMALDERLELRKKVRVATECELGFDARLRRIEDAVLDALDPAAPPELEPDVGERPSPYEGERITEQRDCPFGRLAARLADELVEAIEVELARLDDELVATSAGEDAGLAESL